MPTSNTYIAENDGWVEIVDSPNQVRISGFPHTHPYYLYAGATAPSLIPASATGTITISGLPLDTETVTVGSETYTFVTAATDPFEVTIGADADETGDNLVTAISTNSTIINASNSAGVVTVTSKIPGASYNYSLSEAATNVAVSGAAMTGGADVVEGVLICHHPFEFTEPMTEKLFARIVNPVPTSKRPNGTLRIDAIWVA